MKNLIVRPPLWSDDMDIETTDVFQYIHVGDTDEKVVHFDQLRNRQKTDVNRRLLIDLFQPVN